MATTVCCGCHLIDDYGTSLAFGTGGKNSPFTIQQIDPEFVRPMVRVNNTAAGQTLTAGILTTLSFTTEEFDSAGMWDPGQPTRISLPLVGLWLVGIQANFGAVAGVGDREIILRQEGLQIYNTETQSAASTSTQSLLVYEVETINNLSYVEAILRSDQTVNGSAKFWAVYFSKKSILHDASWV